MFHSSLALNEFTEIDAKGSPPPPADKPDCRYLCIRVTDIRKISKKFYPPSSGKIRMMKLTFQMSAQKSSTEFASYEEEPFYSGSLLEGCHFFRYEGDVNVVVGLEHVPSPTCHYVGEKIKDQDSKVTYQNEKKLELDYIINDEINHKNTKYSISGYCNVILTPFLLIPQTRHIVKAKLLCMSPNRELIYNEVVADVRLEVYYLNDFKAELYVVPLSTVLTRNPGDLGELVPKAIFTVANQKGGKGESKRTEKPEHGGVQIDWIRQTQKLFEDHVTQEKKLLEDRHKAQQKQLNQKIERQKKKSKLESKQRSLEKQKKEKRDGLPKKLESVFSETLKSVYYPKYPQKYQNQFKFSVSSPGQYLRIEVCNFPEFDSDLQLIGQRQMQLVSYELLTTPVRDAQSLMKVMLEKVQQAKGIKIEQFIRGNGQKVHINTVKLQYNNPQTKQTIPAGEIKFLSYCVFDVEAVLKPIIDLEGTESEREAE